MRLFTLRNCFPLRVINAVGVCLFAIDSVCTALMAASAHLWAGTPRATTVNTAVALVQLIALCGERSFCCSFAANIRPRLVLMVHISVAASKC